MAIKPELPKKKQVSVSTRDLKAKKNPKGGAQKKEIIGDAAGLRNTNAAFNRLS